MKTIRLTADSRVRAADTAQRDKFAFEIEQGQEVFKFVRCAEPDCVVMTSWTTACPGPDAARLLDQQHRQRHQASAFDCLHDVPSLSVTSVASGAMVDSDDDDDDGLDPIGDRRAAQRTTYANSNRIHVLCIYLLASWLCRPTLLPLGVTRRSRAQASLPGVLNPMDMGQSYLKGMQIVNGASSPVESTYPGTQERTPLPVTSAWVR